MKLFREEELYQLVGTLDTYEGVALGYLLEAYRRPVGERAEFMGLAKATLTSKASKVSKVKDGEEGRDEVVLDIVSGHIGDAIVKLEKLMQIELAR